MSFPIRYCWVFLSQFHLRMLLMKQQIFSMKFRAFTQKLEFWKSCSCRTDSQYLQTFLMRWVVILSNVVFFFLILHYEMCHLENPLNSVNQYFPNNQCILSNHEWVKNPFKGQDRPVGFSITVTSMISDSTLQLN